MPCKKQLLGQITNNLDSKRIPLNSQQRMGMQDNAIYPYIGANNIMGYVNQYIFDEKILCIAEDGGSWGRNENCATIFNEKCWVNNHAHVLTAKSGVHLEYLCYYLNYTDLSSFITGTTRGKLTKSALNNIPIPLPPLPTQRAIAERLDRADALRQKDRQLLREYDALAQAVFVEMFGDPVRNEKGWEVTPLKSISTKFSDGPFGSNLKTEHYRDQGVRVIRLQNIGIGEFLNGDQSYISREHYENTLKKHTCLPGDVIIATLGDPNVRACIVPEYLNVAINKADCIQCRVNTKIANPQFVCHQLNHPSTIYFASQFMHGQTRIRVSGGQLAKLKLLIPPLSLQTRFAAMLANIERQKDLVRRQQAESEALFGRLLQEAFG